MKIAIVGDVHLNTTFRCRTDNFLETALGKIKYIADNNDKVIFLGDLFHIYSNPTILFNTVYKEFSQYEDKFISILGNHDIFHNNYNSINRTTIGSLELTGVLDIKRDNFELDGVQFDVSPVMKNLKRLGDDTNSKILLGHNYFEMPDCDNESFTKEELAKLNYNMVFLGHDHSPYEEERVGNSTLIRMGSLTRIDTQMYNKDRKIYYYQLDTQTMAYNKLEVPSKPIEECYIEDAFNKTPKKQKSVYTGLSALLSKFDRQQTKTLSMAKVLKKLKATEAHISYIKGVHDANGLPFN